MRTRQLAAILCCLISIASSAACNREDRQIRQHQEALQSLGSTVRAIAGAWLDGRVSGTYAQTALERTFLLVEQERTSLASRPEMLIDERGARLSDTADHLERLIAGIQHAMRGANAVAVREGLADIPIYNGPGKQ
jgi:hypothetical protein